MSCSTALELLLVVLALSSCMVNVHAAHMPLEVKFKGNHIWRKLDFGWNMWAIPLVAHLVFCKGLQEQSTLHSVGSART